MKEPPTDLFPDCHSLSPRLKWLEQHKLETVLQQLPRLGIGPRNTLPWVCHNAAKTVAIFGEDEMEATIRYAEVMNIKHWTLEQAMSEPTQAQEEW